MANTCTACSSECYISLLGNIECSNQKCVHYSEALYPPPPTTEDGEKEEKETPLSSFQAKQECSNGYEITYQWCSNHHDFGD